MGGALDVPGPDLSLRWGEPRPDLRSVGPFPSPLARSDRFLPRAFRLSPVPSMEEKQGGEWKNGEEGKWMKTANHRQPARRLTTGISRDPAIRTWTKAAVVIVVVGVVVDIVFDGRRIKLWLYPHPFVLVRLRSPEALDRVRVLISFGEGSCTVLQRRVS